MGFGGSWRSQRWGFLNFSRSYANKIPSLSLHGTSRARAYRRTELHIHSSKPRHTGRMGIHVYKHQTWSIKWQPGQARGRRDLILQVKRGSSTRYLASPPSKGRQRSCRNLACFVDLYPCCFTCTFTYEAVPQTSLLARPRWSWNIEVCRMPAMSELAQALFDRTILRSPVGFATKILLLVAMGGILRLA